MGGAGRGVGTVTTDGAGAIGTRTIGGGATIGGDVGFDSCFFGGGGGCFGGGGGGIAISTIFRFGATVRRTSIARPEASA